MINIKRIATYLFVYLIVVSTAVGQQEPRMSQNMLLPIAYNPAATGLIDGIDVTLVSRSQWAGAKEINDKYGGSPMAPQTFFIAGDAYLPMLGGGISMVIINEKITPISQTKFRVNYAYQLKINQGNLNLGLMTGLTDQSLDMNRINPEDPNDPFLMALQRDGSSMNFDAGIGVYYYLPNKLRVGLSAMQLMATKARYKTDFVVYQDALSVNLSGNYIITFPYRPKLQLEPGTLMSFSKGIYQMDLNFLARYNKKVWGGVGYRINDAIIAMIGFNVYEFRLGYSYDISTTPMRNGGTHEVSLQYFFKMDFNQKRSYRNVRYL
ncbi:MAG: PorP/SprF family type IX secretion system membrane protein [Bacteroidales bacterium]|nr:PorP/SprF family type IX secretion system membrane protein [Bacteroidales bacterium]